MKLLADPISAARVKDRSYRTWVTSTRRYSVRICNNAPKEHSRTNIPYCFTRRLHEKSLSSKVQTLLRKKLDVIDTIIPVNDAAMYH
ncbi:MAG: hypothetical protein WBW34_03735, partial [Nitrososphaeraceae archaeon]